MAALDRLEWAAGFAATSFGVTIGVRVDDPAWLPALRDRLPPACRDVEAEHVDHLYSVRVGGPIAGTHARRFHLVYGDSARAARTLDGEAALAAFESQVRLDVATHARPWVFVHAGAVAWNGRAIVMPAPSMHGKSRLVEALLRAGATYYSDEFAVLDEEGRVHPFAKPIGVRDDSGVSHPVSATMFGSIESAPYPLGAIVLTSFQADAAWQPRTATAGEGVLDLLANTVRARLEPAHVLAVLARAVEHALVLEGPRGEAHAAASAILAAVDDARHARESRVPSLSSCLSS